MLFSVDLYSFRSAGNVRLEEVGDVAGLPVVCPEPCTMAMNALVQHVLSGLIAVVAPNDVKTLTGTGEPG